MRAEAVALGEFLPTDDRGVGRVTATLKDEIRGVAHASLAVRFVLITDRRS